MKAITQVENALEIARNWLQPSDHPHSIPQQVLALGPTTTIKEIDEIVGGASWTHITCSECLKEKDKLVEFGNMEDSRHFRLCLRCLSGALKLVEE